MRLMGPKETEKEAYDLGFQTFSGYFEVLPLRTANETQATHLLRGLLVTRGKVDAVSRRIKHKDTKEEM